MEISAFNNIELSDQCKQLFKRSIKIIAVGGCGGNVLNHLLAFGHADCVDVLAANTDLTTLERSLSENKLVIGEKLTRGNGAGGKPEIGEQAAKESIDEIRAFMEGADMVYIAAGMGGGTGTGAAHVIAHAAKEMGILTVAVVTKPFTFEGKRRMRLAKEGIEKLYKEVDAIIIIPNQKVLDTSDIKAGCMECYALVNEVLRQAVQGVTDLITRSGMVNVDFADLRTVMRGAGHSVMGIGSADGDGAVERAVKRAIESPLMECSMHGARGVLMNISYKGDLPLYEISRASAMVEECIDEDANFIWGCVKAPIKNDVEVTIIAAGFDEFEEKDTPKPAAAQAPTPKPAPAPTAEEKKPFERTRRTYDKPELPFAPAPEKEEKTELPTEQTTDDDMPKYAYGVPEWLLKASTYQAPHQSVKYDEETVTEFNPRRRKHS